MTYKNDKVRDLTPLVTSFIPGESPTAQKLQGMIRQSDAAIDYIENKLGDLAGEEAVFSTWISTLARNVGDFSKLNPLVLPSFQVTNYNQSLVAGKVEHELDMIPVGPLNDLIQSTLDSCVVISQWKNSVAELEQPGDWTIAFSYIENGNTKRGRKLVTHSPSEGGNIIFKSVTSGRGSSIEGASENTIPSLAQAEDGGPFVTIDVIDSLSKTYQVTLPVRTKVYDKLGEIVNFSASNTQSGVGLNSQYQLPPFFFGVDGLDLDSDDIDGFPKSIPLNLIKLYDWSTKKEVEGIIFLQANTSAASRTYQFTLQTKQDVILNTSTGQYIVVVPGNSIANQLKGLVETVYGNTGIGNDMTRLISHKNLLDLRTGSTDYTNRSAFYGSSSIDNNDHSMYLHRNGYTASDKGGGGNILRGHLVVGSTTTGSDDTIHENFNVDTDSFSAYFGNILSGGEIKYKKAEAYMLDHSYGGLPLGTTDAGLMITGAKSDINPTRRNLFLIGDIRTDGNIVLGKSASDVLFIQSKVYVNDELTFIPKLSSTVLGEEGKVVYDPSEKALVFHNGSRFVSPWNLSGYTTVVGNGVTSFGKYNGTNQAPFISAVAEAAVNGGVVKVLPGTYNFLANKVDIPANVIIEGSGEKTIIVGSGLIFNTTGSNAILRDLKVTNGTTGFKVNNSNCSIGNVLFDSSAVAISIDPAAINFKILENVTYNNCAKTTDYSNATFIKTSETIAKSAVNYAFGSTVNDWNAKEEILREYVVNSGVAVVTLDQTIDGAIGKGAFRIVGDGNIVCKRLLPVNPNVGIGGNINLAALAGTPSVSVGVICYDRNYTNLGVRSFLIPGVAVTTGTVESRFYKEMLVGINASGMYFPTGTRFVQPIISVSLNTGGILFDSFEITNMTYARSATWA